MTDGRTLRCCTIVIVLAKAMLLTSSLPVRHDGLIHEVDASTNTSSLSVFSGGRLIKIRMTEIPRVTTTHRRQGDGTELDPCNCAAWLCDNGFYQEADSYTGCEACKPCPTVCPDGMWMSGLCTPVHSGCSACRVCSADEYISTACGGSQQTVCSKCTACAAGYFANISCSATADNVCVECPNAKANFSFFTGIYNATASLCLWQCNPTTNLSNTGTCECAPGRFYSLELDLNNFDISSQAYRPKGCIQCQDCAPGTFVARQADDCSTARDRRCSPCPNKLPQLATWTGTYADGFCQYICPAGRVPSRKVHPKRNGSFVDSCACAHGYYTEDGGATCKQCRTCSDSQYTESACESTRNTQCGSCSGLKPLNSEFTSYSTLLGRCNWRCKAGYFQPGDRQECSACTNCILGQYVKSDCTPNQDRECSPCPNRPPPHSSYTGDYDLGSLRCTFKCDETFVEVVNGPSFDQRSCECPAGSSMPTGGTRCGPCKTCQATGSLVATASEAVSQWAMAPCAAVGTDTICANCTKCNSTEFVYSPCNAAGDTVCQQCARCDWPNQWMQSACSSGWSGWFSDTTESGTVEFEVDMNATTVKLTPAMLTLQVGEYLKTSAHEYMLVISIVHANSSTVTTVERNGIATSAPFGLILGKTETVQAGSNVTRTHAIVSNSSNSLNHIGHDTVCRACSPYQCPLGQHGVQCGYFTDTTCANCSNAIPEHAHWTGTWSPPNPAPGSAVKCHYDCNPLFVLISNTTSDECQCSVGRYLHTFTPNEAHSFTQKMLPTARGECRKCDLCKEGERILTACNRTHNTVCIPCPQAMTFAANASVQHFHMTKACLGTNSCSVIFDRVEADVELSIAVALTGATKYTASLFTEGRSFELDLEQEGLQSSTSSGCDQRHDILRQRTIETKTAHTSKNFTLLITSSSSSHSCPATDGSKTMFSLLAYVTINRARARWNHSATSGTVYDNEIGRCEWQCDEGYQKTANGTGCDCGDGRYVNSDNVHGGACLNCTSCPLASVSLGRGKMVLETCTRTKNAVCVDCCNDKPPDSFFTGEFSLDTGICEWHCNPGFYKVKFTNNHFTNTSNSTTAVPVSTAASWNGMSSESACRFVFDGSGAGKSGAGVAHGDDFVCRKCQQCGSDEYVSTNCSANHDTVCEKCANSSALPRNAHYLRTAQNVSGIMICDWQCNAGFSKANTTCETCESGRFLNATSSSCQRCRTCPSGTYKTMDCGPGNDTQCRLCPNEIPSAAIFTGSTQMDSNGTVWCTYECGQGHWLNMTGGPNGQCVKCGLCEPGTFLAGSCTKTKDTSCLACPNRLPIHANFTGTYSTEKGQCEWQCMQHLGFYLNLSHADPCRCAEQGSYLETSQGLARCKPCSICKPGTYTSTKCNRTNDAICSRCPNSKPYMSDFTGRFPVVIKTEINSSGALIPTTEILNECEWKCNANFERKLVQGTYRCECISSTTCRKCAALPRHGKLLNICQMYTENGVCTFDDSTIAGIMIAVLLPLTLADFDNTARNGFVQAIASAAGVSFRKVEIVGVSAARRASVVFEEKWEESVMVISGVRNRRAASISVETMVSGRLRQLLALLTGTDALNAALKANGLPASTGLQLKRVNNGVIPSPPPPPNITIIPEPSLTDDTFNVILAAAGGAFLGLVALLAVLGFVFRSYVVERCSQKSAPIRKEANESNLKIGSTPKAGKAEDEAKGRTCSMASTHHDTDARNTSNIECTANDQLDMKKLEIKNSVRVELAFATARAVPAPTVEAAVSSMSAAPQSERERAAAAKLIPFEKLKNPSRAELEEVVEKLVMEMPGEQDDEIAAQAKNVAFELKACQPHWLVGEARLLSILSHVKGKSASPVVVAQQQKGEVVEQRREGEIMQCTASEGSRNG